MISFFQRAFGAFAGSLSLRLLGIFIVTGAAVLVVLSILFSRGLGSQWQRNIQPHLALYARYLQQDLGNPPSPARAQVLADALPIRITLYRRDRPVYDTSGEVFDPRQLSFRPLRDFRRWADRDSPPLAIGVDRHRHLSVLRMSVGEHTVYLELLQGRGPDRRHSPLVMLVLALLAVLSLSYAVIRRQLKPIARIQGGVQRMATGDLDHRIALQGRDDLASLAGSVDAMALRIQAMLDAKRQLLLAISHELRSPLARARVAIELLEPSTNRDRLREDLDAMQSMIADIIESERLQQHAVLNLAPVELSALIRRVAHELDTAVQVEAPTPPVMLVADATRLAILLRNLINNALQHGTPAAEPHINNALQHGSPLAEPHAATVKVTLDVHADELVVRVIDQGPGIAAEHVDALTEPFFRPDAARTRHTGGVGLGLTLAHLIAEAHHGRLIIHSRTQTGASNANVTGTCVAVHLPCVQPVASPPELMP